MQSARTKPKTHNHVKQVCDVCNCRLGNVFSGVHVITDGTKQKTVCGLCAAYASTNGWNTVAQARSVGS